MPRPLSSPNARFDAQYVPEPNSGCWLWTGFTESNGYGRLLVKLNDKWGHASVHRFSYERFVGPIPKGLSIDHKCRVRCCVNPDHLQAVTTRENILLGEGLCAVNAGKTHCPKGHEYTPGNTEISPRGRRLCRQCRREESRRRNQLSKARRHAARRAK